MNDSHIYVGLDIGTTSIKALVCEDVKGELRVVGVGTQPAGGLSRGVIVDIEKTAHAIQAAVRQATEKSGIKIDKVIVGLPANYLQMTEVHGMITVANQGQPREIINQDVIDVASAAMTQNLPPEREVIDLVLRDFAVDDFNKIEDPRGMVAVRLELRATMYSGPKTIVHNTKKAVALAGLQIQDLVVAPIATGFELLSDGEQDFGTVLVDLGGGQTTTSIIHDHQLILGKVGVQLGRDRAAERDRAVTVIMQIDDCRNKILFFCIHTSRTSSRSYTVLILPDSTLTSLGASFITRTTVGRESSISLAFRMGFILKRLLW